MDATKMDSLYVSSADKVLIDVPCSGIGIIRKKPEIKWNKTRKSLKELIPTQREIMENAWQYLKNGGTMIYSTCTLNKEENEDIEVLFFSFNEISDIIQNKYGIVSIKTLLMLRLIALENDESI